MDGSERLGPGNPPTPIDWVAGTGSQQKDGRRSGDGPASTFLADHDAVKWHGLGMESPELANFVEAFGSYVQGRILTTGKDQYEDDGGQRFEEMSLAELLDESLDELADVVAYASMLAIKLLAVRRRFVK